MRRMVEFAWHNKKLRVLISIKSHIPTICLQGSDFNSTAGFDTLSKRLRDGKQVCMDFEEFIKQRYLMLHLLESIISI